MPLTEKGEKIKGAMEKQYGSEKGEQVFYASKNKGKITGVDDYTELEEGTSKEVRDRNVRKLVGAGHKTEVAHQIAERKARGDDNQHMGFTGEMAKPVAEFASKVDALAARMDFFVKKQQQRQPAKVKPRTKDAMQPSNRHPKKVPKP